MAADGGATSCPATRVLRVAVAPELAPVVRDAAEHAFPRGGAPGGTCVRADVVAADPADIARAVTAEPPDRPDVWIPDASLWLDRVRAAGVLVPPEHPSVATSPTVLAVARDRAEALGWLQRRPSLADLVRDPSTRLALRDPAADAATATDLVGLFSVTAEHPDARALLAQQLRRAAETRAASREQLLTAAGSGAASTVSEQAVLAHDHQAGASPVVAVYPDSGGVLDYPFAVLTHNAADARSAGRLLAALQGDGVRGALLSLGFRDGRGLGTPVTGPASGIDPTATPASVTAPQLADALRTERVVTSGTRMLAVVDVSGSMGQPVPGAAGATRMQVTKEAAGQGVSLYSDDAQIGLWVFSRHLPPATDYQEVVPIGPLGLRPDGRLGREELSRALAGVQQVPDGDTGLYDTVLAAVRAVRQGWDPTRVNSVVILTDGRDDDEDGIGLNGLLTALHQEADPAEPVPVITIGLGPDSDTQALAAISRATGGSSYLAQNGDDVYAVFQDAIGQRSCRPRC
jgi:Mg-chelatase subunit ChlD